jgi:uncharacterized surface protein with fasciclin (FAS1) repeats
MKLNAYSLFPPAGRTCMKFIFLAFSTAVLHSCNEEPQIWRVDSERQVIGDFVANHPERYSEFYKLIRSTDMHALLNTRGPFTLFLPNNEAMRDYYTEKNVSSLEEFDPAFLKDLFMNHIVPLYIESIDIGLGTLSEKNALGDYLVSEFDGSEIIISKYSRIVDRDIRAANGVIHEVNRVLDPVTADIYSVVSADPSYSIFSEGLERSGLKDTLGLISFPYGHGSARTRFTVLAVPDTIYHRYGIMSVDDLVDWLGANPDSVTFLENPFYRYMEYHCLNGSYYLSDINTGIYPILSRDNNISFTIDTEDYKINYDSKTKQYTGFIIRASNIPAKNGALHTIDDLLPVTEPAPATVIFETTDFFDLQQGDYYQSYYQRWWDGQNTFEKIKWHGEYLLYYYQPFNTDIMNHDCLSTLGWWEVSITFPKVMKGEYEVYVFQPGWYDITNCVAYIDGVKTPYLYEGNYAGTGGNGGLQKIGDVVFTTTCEHTITLHNVVGGMLFWDYVQFDPVKH